MVDNTDVIVEKLVEIRVLLPIYYLVRISLFILCCAQPARICLRPASSVKKLTTL